MSIWISVETRLGEQRKVVTMEINDPSQENKDKMIAGFFGMSGVPERFSDTPLKFGNKRD